MTPTRMSMDQRKSISLVCSVLLLVAYHGSAAAVNTCPNKDCFIDNNTFFCEYADCSSIPGFNESDAIDLQRIHLTNNVIKNVTQLKPMSSLLYLDLSNNLISYIENEAFIACPELRSLNLTENNIGGLREEMFKGLTKLAYLELGRNMITQLNDNVFRGLNALVHLNLSRNHISELDTNDLSDMNVQVLLLNGNKLKSLHANYFLGLDNVQHLDLSENKIEIVNISTFHDMVNLRALDLRYNHIQYVEHGHFHGLMKLETLHLSNNHINSFSDLAFKGLGGLTSLYLDYNTFIQLQGGLFPSTMDTISISSCPNLSELDNDTFDGVINLGKAYVKNNPKLKSLQPGVFGGVASTLTVLDLGSNALSTLDKNLLAWDRLKYLNLSGNPWNCDCHLVWMKKERLPSDTTQSMICASPKHLTPYTLASVEPDSLKCGFINMYRYSLGVALIATTVFIFVAIVGILGYRYRRRLFPCRKDNTEYQTLYNSGDEFTDDLNVTIRSSQESEGLNKEPTPTPV